jgi:uncharacterized membrane protein YhhN
MDFLTIEAQNQMLVDGSSQFFWSFPFLVIFFLMAGITWYAAAIQNMHLYKITKPLVILPLIIWFILRGRTESPYIFFILGLCFSLIGDIFLAFWTKTTFFIGMFIFGIAHIFYAIGYSHWPTVWFSFGNLLLVPAMVILFATLAYRPAASKDPKMKTYFQAAMAYGVLILTMLVLAGTSFWRQGWTTIPATMALLGAMLFVTSSILIALEVLGYTQKNVRFWVISTYHLSQFLIASSVLYVANGGFYL